MTPTPACPRSGTGGQPVGWKTVAAQVRLPLPPKQLFWLCAEPDCPVVYFGDQGAVFESTELHVAPGFKGSAGGLLCYCFGFTGDDFERERERRRGPAPAGTISETIRERTRAGECACEVRNPSGRCCLGEIARFLRSLDSRGDAGSADVAARTARDRRAAADPRESAAAASRSRSSRSGSGAPDG